MFEDSSRYARIEIATLTQPDGTTVAYKRRRFLPPPDSLPLLAETLVQPGDRLDFVAARTLGDPEQFWRIADANGADEPDTLTAEPGRALRVPLPQP